MLRNLVSCCLLWSACGTPTITEPLYFQVDPSVLGLPQARQDRIVSAGWTMLDAWRSMGGTTDPAAAQVITLEWGGASTAWRAATTPSTRVVTFYEPSFASGIGDQEWLLIAWHEAGHIMGAVHIDCAQPGVMVPNIGCFLTSGSVFYTLPDVQDICDGGFDGKICQTFPPSPNSLRRSESGTFVD